MSTNKTNQLDFVKVWSDRMNGSHKTLDEREFSVTELLKDATAITLKRRHSNEIELDVQDLADINAGTAVHESIEQDAEKLGWITEFELGTIVFDSEHAFNLYGKGDFYRDGVLCDLKNTKEATYNKNRFANDVDLFKNEWQTQLTAYSALLYDLKPDWFVGVDKMLIEARITDLSVVGNAKKGESTDKWRLIEFPAPTQEQRQKVIDGFCEKVNEVIALENVSDEELPICSEEYRFASSVWKIYGFVKGTTNLKATAERGHANYATEEEANEAFKNAGFTENDHKVKKVGGESIKCKYYCDCKDFCPHYRKMMEEELRKRETINGTVQNA